MAAQLLAVASFFFEFLLSFSNCRTAVKTAPAIVLLPKYAAPNMPAPCGEVPHLLFSRLPTPPGLLLPGALCGCMSCSCECAVPCLPPLPAPLCLLLCRCMKVVKLQCPGVVDPQPVECDVPMAVPGRRQLAHPSNMHSMHGTHSTHSSKARLSSFGSCRGDAGGRRWHGWAAMCITSIVTSCLRRRRPPLPKPYAHTAGFHMVLTCTVSCGQGLELNPPPPFRPLPGPAGTFRAAPAPAPSPGSAPAPAPAPLPVPAPAPAPAPPPSLAPSPPSAASSLAHTSVLLASLAVHLLCLA